MKPIQSTSSIRVQRALPLLGALLFFSSLFLLSCGDFSDDDDDDAPKFGINVLAGGGTSTDFSSPTGIAVTSDGTVYVADNGNNIIRKIETSGTVTDFAGGAAAGLSNPTGITATPDGKTFYVAETGNNRLRKITISTRAAVTIPIYRESGTTTRTQFSSPNGVAVTPDGTVYVADTGNSLIRKIDTSNMVTTVSVGVLSPKGVAVDSAGNLYVVDSGNNRIRKVTPEGAASTLAGGTTSGTTDGQGADAKFSNPSGIAVAPNGTVYVADTGNNSIRKITAAGKVTTIVKDLNGPVGIALSSDGSTAYIANTGSEQILKLSNLSLAGSAPLEITLVQSIAIGDNKSTQPVGNQIVILGGTFSALSPPTTLTATSNIPGGTPTWSVTPSDGSIATITPDGANAKVEGKTAGTATLTVTINGLRKEVEVTVTDLGSFGGTGGAGG